MHKYEAPFLGLAPAVRCKRAEVEGIRYLLNLTEGSLSQDEKFASSFLGFLNQKSAGKDRHFGVEKILIVLFSFFPAEKDGNYAYYQRSQQGWPEPIHLKTHIENVLGNV